MDFPFINGRAKSWASVSIRVLPGEPPITSFTAVSYSQKLERGKLHGKGTHPRKKTRGKYEADGSISGDIDTMAYLRARFAALSPQGYALYDFTITIQYSEQDGGPIQTVELIDCNVAEESNDESNGSSDASIEEWPLTVMRIRKNGLEMVSPIAQ